MVEKFDFCNSHPGGLGLTVLGEDDAKRRLDMVSGQDLHRLRSAQKSAYALARKVRALWKVRDPQLGTNRLVLAG